MDENLSDQVARIARAFGLDAVSSHEIMRDGIDDDAQLLWAAERGRCLVTRDRGDFWALSKQFAESGQPHAGVVLVPRSFPNRDFAGIARALAMVARRYPNGLPSYAVVYLSAAES